MGEGGPAVGSLQDARLLGAPHAARRPVPSFPGGNDQLLRRLRRAGRGRHDEEPIGGARRERGKSRPAQFLEVLRNGERFAGRRPDVPAGEGVSDLEGEERVPVRDPVEPEQERAREIPFGPVSQEACQRLLAQRADGHPLEGDRPRMTQTERVAAGADAQRRQDPDRRILQTAGHERQHPGRGHIEPLDIVDRDDHRSGRGQRAQDPQRRDRHGSLVRRSALDSAAREDSTR